jgi:hypothetical protein
MATIITIAQFTATLGQRTVTTPAIPSNVTEYIIHLQQVGWPHAQDKVFDYSMEIAVDGVNFTRLCGGDVWDFSVPAKGTKPLDAFNLGVGPLPGAGLATRKLRITWDFAKSVTMSGSIEAL